MLSNNSNNVNNPNLEAFLDRYTVGFEKFRRYLMGDDDGQPKDSAWAARISGIHPFGVFVSLEDETGIANLVVMPDVYARCRAALRGSAFLVARGWPADVLASATAMTPPIKSAMISSPAFIDVVPRWTH